MFSDNTTRDLAKTAFKIMTKDIQEEETPTQELAESTQIDEVQQLAELLDALLIEGIAQYIGSLEEQLSVNFDAEQINEMTTNIMEEINALDDEDKVQLGESLIEAHKNSLTED